MKGIGGRAHRASIVACVLLAAAFVGLPLRAAPSASSVPTGATDALAPGIPLQARLRAIWERIQRAVHYPELARERGVSGTAVVSFEIDPGGRPEQVRIEQSSGFESLDRAARESVQRAGRLPWVWGRVLVPVRFVLEEGG